MATSCTGHEAQRGQGKGAAHPSAAFAVGHCVGTTRRLEPWYRTRAELGSTAIACDPWSPGRLRERHMEAITPRAVV